MDDLLSSGLTQLPRSTGESLPSRLVTGCATRSTASQKSERNSGVAGIFRWKPNEDRAGVWNLAVMLIEKPR